MTKLLKLSTLMLIIFIFTLQVFADNITHNDKKKQQLNETAKFIAGKPINQNSKLYRYTRTKSYKIYKRHIRKLWNKFYTQKLKKIEKWRYSHIPADYTETVFYPFSGPDITNPLAFFPKAKDYIMIGLESPGEVPNPYVLNWRQKNYRLWQVRKALRTLLRINFFRTKEMWQDIKRNSFSSLTGILMFFLSSYNYEIINIRKITVNKNGDIILRKSNSIRIVRGVEIIFKKNGAQRSQRLRFFKVDLSDPKLRKNYNFMAYLKKYNNFTNITKAASYLLSWNNFRIVRSYILKRSKYILQSDCGIPYKYFNRKKWDVRIYGRYWVLKVFLKLRRYQRDYAYAIRKYRKGILPFSYGYGYSAPKSNLLFAIKKEVKQ